MARPVQLQEANRSGSRSVAWQPQWILALGLVAAVFLAYQPAWRAGFVWDDNAHITRPELRSWHGLHRIWFDLKATQQYYPLLHSAFWIEYRLWGGNPLSYHLVNILLHATVALLVALILRRLAVPGAYLAAAIFALHPVCVESVAWITEQKNTLSALFYLLAMMAYLRFDQSGRSGTGPLFRAGTGAFFGGRTSLGNQRFAENMDLSPHCGSQTRETRFYVVALGLFVLALLSKTVTATLPAALLVIFWWQRGRLTWRRDVLPLVPFFVLGTMSGVFTAWVERRLIGAEGVPFALTTIERFLIAGRVIWFYLAKLFWPANLMFIYPRWRVHEAVWWQYLFPAAALALVVVLWLLRRWWRGPLAGLLFFAGTLFPVLGFFNVFPFVYSFVADHFQYLASLGVIALMSAGIAVLLQRRRLWNRPTGHALCLTLLATLATLTWRQSRIYVDLETLYRATIAANPRCAMAYTNLGIALADRGRIDDAIALLQKSLELNPNYWAAHYNLGTNLMKSGRADEALAHYQRTLKLAPNNVMAHTNLAVILASRGQVDEAIAHYQKALEIDPDCRLAHRNFATTLASCGRVDEAIAHYRKAIELKPDSALPHYGLAMFLRKHGRDDDAIAHYEKALEITPEYAEARHGLGVLLTKRGQIDDAVACFRKALEAKPNDREAQKNLDIVLTRQQELRRVLHERRDLLRAQPNNTTLLNDIAWMLATNPNASIRDGSEAVNLAERAAELSRGQNPSILGTLAAAYAEAGRFPEAVQTAQRALDLARQQNKPDAAESIEPQVRLYETGTPFRETPPCPTRP